IIEKFNVPLPGRVADDGDAKLYTKQDYKSKKASADTQMDDNASEYDTKAIYFLEGLGGKDNIKDVTNCATRLRVTVKDPSLVKDNDYFTHNQMAHGVAK
ncbi:PTS alpha-glucoside transporter subunit IIBC, partial [Flavobacterium circumlabens]